MTKLTQLHIPSGREIYDELMSEIEPELVSENLPRLANIDRNETSEERAVRAMRYTQAFREYDARYLVYMQDLHSRTRHVRREVASIAECDDREEDMRSMESMESLFRTQ
jgi:hypothetical protein